MGLFGWIKKDANQHRRRQSAPPSTKNITSPSSSTANGASAARDDAYIEALNKFNQWRTNQKLERISEGFPLRSDTDQRISSLFSEGKESEGGAQSDFSSDAAFNSAERRALNRRFELPKSPRYTRHRQDGVAPKKPKRSVEFYRNINRIPENGELSLNNGKNNNMADRFSLPAMMTAPMSRNIKPMLSKSNNNTIYENEVEEFEQMHVQDNLGDTYAVQSPPNLFFKENSSPYMYTSTLVRNTNPTIVDATPKKQVNLLQKRCRNFKDKPAPQPPIRLLDPPASHNKQHNRTNESDTESPFAGSYRKYEINSSSIYDEHVISSRAYRGEMKPLNSSGQNSTMKKQRRKSPSYQTIINKHGDLVDYALPFSDANESHSELNSTKNEGDLLNDIRACEEVINENFRFLNSDVQPSTIILDDTASLITEPISVLKQRAPQIVTDLDKSLMKEEPELGDQLNEVDLVIHEPQDILLELDSLEKWSKSIQISDDFLQKQFAEKNMLEFFQQASNLLLICWPKEVHYRVGVLRSSFAAPLEFSCGLFRNVPVTLRKYSLNFDRNLYFAEQACKKDFELLSHIKHYAIASLMAICFDSSLNQATLILEPFDFTLFDYIHKMNKRLSILHAITVVQQISSAVSFLQECGYIHSNISSGCILMRKYPYAVKLTSFELTTETSDAIRKEIENRYGSTSSSRNSMTSSQNEELKKITTYSRLIKNDEQFLRDKYRKLSKEISDSRKGQTGPMGDNSAYDCRASRYLPYCKEYREKFSMFYYVAPELLVPKSNFVFPTKSTDVYSLTLLLWEILNGYVPFVVYSRQELEKLQVSANLQLPMFEKERCDRFRQVFETGLADLSGRQISVADIMDALDCFLLEQGMDKTSHMNGFSEDFEEHMNSSEIRKKNELNDKRKQNVPEKTDKIYFQSNSGYANLESIKKMSRESTLVDIDEPVTQKTKQQPKKPERKINKMKTPKDFSDDPQPTKKSPLSSGLSNSAIYQSIFDFNNKFLSPRSSKQVIYERTSTVKKPKSSVRSNKVAAKELFEPTNSFDKGDSTQKISSEDSKEHATPRQQAPEVIGPLEVCTKECPVKMNINTGKEESHRDILEKTPECDRTNEIQPTKTSKSCDSSPGTKRKNYNRLSNSMRFTIGDFSLPDTPIARKNKIRKHAWLSDQKLVLTDDNTSTPVTPQGRRASVFFNDLGNRISRDGCSSLRSNPLNLNISSSMQEIKPQRVNISLNIIKGPNLSEKLKAHSQEFHMTAPAIVDIDIDDESEIRETSKKAESTDNIFEDMRWKKEKKLCEQSQLHHSADNLDNDDQSDGSEKIVTSHLTSVRDAVRKIETNFENTGYDYSPNKKHESPRKSLDNQKICNESVVVEEHLLVPTKVLELERTIEQLPPIEEPNNAVARLDVVLTNNTLKKKDELFHQQTPKSAQPRSPLPEASAFSPNSQLFIRRKATNGSSVIQRTVYRESIVSSTDLPGLDGINSSQSSCTAPIPPGNARKKKLTTRVTVNMRKISRRASDIGGSPASTRPSSLILDEDASTSGCVTPTPSSIVATAPIRHSCGSDLLKAFATLRLVPGSEESKCSNREEDRKSLCTPVKANASNSGASNRNVADRFVCCNCGNSMVPAENLNVPAGSRIGMSAAFSELNFPRESLASMFEDNLGLISQQQQHLSRGTPTIPNKSTEDLYIDDDFCQGLKLGANMELVEFIDDGHYLDEFGYDIYATEEIYDHAEEEFEDECDGNGAGEARAILSPLDGEASGPVPDEKEFLNMCADLNADNAEVLEAVFSPTAETETGQDQEKPSNGQSLDH